MFKPQLKFQKILFIIAIIVAAITFVYSLGLMTDLYGLYQSLSLGGVGGSDLFNNMQGYNHYLVLSSIGLIIVSCLPFIFASHTRRKYYIGNFVVTIIQSVSFVLVAVFIIVENIIYRSQFLKIDFATYKAMAEMMSWDYTESTFFFDIGFVIAALLLILAGLFIYNYNWKTKLVKKENEILGGQNNG